VRSASDEVPRWDALHRHDKLYHVRVLCLDVDLPDPRVTHVEFASTTSVFEYDVVVWDPVNTFNEYIYTKDVRDFRTYYGLPYLDPDESMRFLSEVKRRRAEFEEFLGLGRTLVVFAAPPQELYIDTGQRQTSGTGRNQKVTNLVDKQDLLSALPYRQAAMPAQGSTITVSDLGLSAIIRRYREWWYYRAILEDFPGQCIAVVTGTGKALGSFLRTDSNGVIVQLPDVHPSMDKPSDDGHGEGAKADSPEDEPEASMSSPKELYRDLLDWIAGLRISDDDTPAWLRDFIFIEAEPQTKRLHDLQGQITKLAEQVSLIQREQAFDRRWLTLVTGTGSALEARVTEAFELLGFVISAPVVGRRDIRMTADQGVAVVEVKGVGKSSAESHVMQLEKWVAEAYLENEKPHKGILVVTSWRELPLDQRAEPTFPPQMVPTAEARGHCLMTGLQLLSMVRAVLIGRADKADVRAEVMNKVGVLTDWDDLSSLFVNRTETAADAL